MTLYDLMNNMTLQGNIEVRVMNDDGEAVKTEYFDSVDDLECCEIFRLEDMENLEVQYMYAENACMVIELEKTEEQT